MFSCLFIAHSIKKAVHVLSRIVKKSLLAVVLFARSVNHFNGLKLHRAIRRFSGLAKPLGLFCNTCVTCPVILSVLILSWQKNGAQVAGTDLLIC